MAAVRWLSKALDDFAAARAFIARDSPSSADEFTARILESADRLSSFPRSGRVVPEVGRDTVREILFGEYRVIYRLAGDDVTIVLLTHGRRRLDLSELPP